MRRFATAFGRVVADGRFLSPWSLAATLVLSMTIMAPVGAGVDVAALAPATLATTTCFVLALGALALIERQVSAPRVREAPILLLDEPTAGLDEESEAVVTAALLRLAKSRTTLLVTHNMSLAAEADRICFMDDGRIVEQGSHGELIAKRGRYATWFAQQQSRSHRADVKLSVVS